MAKEKRYTFHDVEGTELRCGQLVAFNYSGAIAKGKIHAIRPVMCWRHHTTACDVRIVNAAHNLHSPSHVSRVRNSDGILVLAEPGQFDPTPYRE